MGALGEEGQRRFLPVGLRQEPHVDVGFAINAADLLAPAKIMQHRIGIGGADLEHAAMT